MSGDLELLATELLDNYRATKIDTCATSGKVDLSPEIAAGFPIDGIIGIVGYAVKMMDSPGRDEVIATARLSHVFWREHPPEFVAMVGDVHATTGQRGEAPRLRHGELAERHAASPDGGGVVEQLVVSIMHRDRSYGMLAQTYTWDDHGQPTFTEPQWNMGDDAEETCNTALWNTALWIMLHGDDATVEAQRLVDEYLTGQP